ncbi:MAG: SNF2-related protein [Betaproteobacteria bacterium]
MIRELLRRLVSRAGAAGNLRAEPTEEGLRYALFQTGSSHDAETAFNLAGKAAAQDQALATYLAQLVQEEIALVRDDAVVLPWSAVYELLRDEEHAGCVELLGLAPLTDLTPVLGSKQAMSDPGFEIFVDVWTSPEEGDKTGRCVGGYLLAEQGAKLLGERAWRLASEVRAFQNRPQEARTQHFHELAWGRIRTIAQSAQARIASKYLATTVVLTPETLELPLAKVEALGTRVLTVFPTFRDAPDEWLSTFDRFGEVQPHYDVTQGGNRVRIVLSEPVRRVLTVIKKQMPARQVAGAKAEAFIRNPYAVLGEDAHAAIDEAKFQEAKASGGLLPCVFTLHSTVKGGNVEGVGLLVTQHYPDGAAKTDRVGFESPELLERFLLKLEKALQEERQMFPWEEFDLDLDGESSRHLEEGRQLLHLWRAKAQQSIPLEEVYSLTQYGERIEGIGIAKPIYSPFIKRQNESADDPWAPENLVPLLGISLPNTTERVFVELDKAWIDSFEQSVAKAESEGRPEVSNVKLPTPVATAEARRLADSFRSLLDADSNLDHKPSKQSDSAPSARRKRETLLVKANIQQIDYVEQRKVVLTIPSDRGPDLPSCLRPTVKLKPHQERGVAWLQHLIGLSPTECRGALLADDMGLGKTLQLATALARYYESTPDGAPTLIVAPVTLLDNWKNEFKTFFNDQFPPVVTLYGEQLAQVKQPKSYIDDRLLERGIGNLLKPGWLAGAKIVLTTYETLRDYEFSLAKQDFAFMICDEAQKIKTPNALITLAAKKQKVAFKIACTGTPVENTLADIWCLFDYIQPGLLGALDEFGRSYRRPIEAKTEEHRNALDRLRAMLAPQLLRRTKADIAGDLPKKIFVTNSRPNERLQVELSNYQRQLYVEGLRRIRSAAAEADLRQRARLSFGVLHFIKAVCAEPFCLPGGRFAVDRAGEIQHLEKSPKMRWMLDELERIQVLQEKVIIFTELRQVQSALYHFLNSRFGLKPFIINGDTESRQGLIDKFQQKPGFNAIVLSPLAAGFGLNIVAANHVIHFTRTWNPAKENQATDRAYRIGQTKDVYVYCPTIVAPDFVTFEAKLDGLMRAKSALATDMLDGSGGDFGLADLAPEGPTGSGLETSALTLDDVDRMDGDTFEVFCKLLWEKQGFSSRITRKRKGDGGVDVVALSGKSGVLIQCKHSGGADSEMGWDAIKEVVGGAAGYQAMHAGVKFSRLALTNRTFNANAREQANHNHVVLVEREKLGALLGGYPVLNTEFHDELSRRHALDAH